MNKGILMVFSNPSENREEEFNDWYTRRFIPKVLETNGFIAAQRYRLADVQTGVSGACPWRYLAVYEIEADNLEAARDALMTRARSGELPVSDVMDAKTLGSFVFVPITERMTRA